MGGSKTAKKLFWTFLMGGCTIRWGNGHCPAHVAVGGGGPLGFRQLAGPGALSLRRRACNKSPVFGKYAESESQCGQDGASL